MVDREFADLAAEAEEEHLADLAGAAAIIGGALAAFLLRQLPRIGRNLREFGVPERAWESFSEIDEVTRLRQNLRPAFERVVEAQVVKDVVRLPGSAERSSKRNRAMPSKMEAAVAYQRRWARFGKKLPDALRNAVNHATETAVTQQYWAEVASSQLELAEQEFAASLKEISNRQRAADETIKRLKKRVKSRAAAGGETEANGAVNAGHSIVGDVRAAAGLEDFKTWMTVADERVRKTHQALHRVAVARTAMFSVGGHLAPHPGWWELPIQQKIRCRCFLWLGAGADTFDYPLSEELRVSVF